MTTRSRTALFLQLRQSYHNGTTTTRGQPSLDTEKIGLISQSVGGDNIASTINLPLSSLNDDDNNVPPPPSWLNLVHDIEATIDRIQHQLTQLDSLHKKHLLPGFDDHSDTEITIHNTATNVTTMFRQCQSLMKQFNNALYNNNNNNTNKQSNSPSPHEIKLHKNIATSLATRISNLSIQFRKSQSNYMARLKNRTVLSSPLFTLSDMDDNTINNNNNSPLIPFTQAQEKQIHQNELVIREREQEIESIAKTIGEIAELFRDMQTMIVEQGSLLDRIDYNLTVAASNVDRGNDELNAAQTYQVAARKKMLIFLLILAILFVIILLAIRRRRT